MMFTLFPPFTRTVVISLLMPLFVVLETTLTPFTPLVIISLLVPPLHPNCEQNSFSLFFFDKQLFRRRLFDWNMIKAFIRPTKVTTIQVDTMSLNAFDGTKTSIPYKSVDRNT